LLIPLAQVRVVDRLTRVSVASAEKNYHDGHYEDRDLEEAAHLKRVVGLSFGRNSTYVLFEWPAKNFALMGRDCLARVKIKFESLAHALMDECESHGKLAIWSELDC
jgi:hypothetical protein